MTYEELAGQLGRTSPAPERAYALLVPVWEGTGGLHLLFEVRSRTLRRQPGEVCFPGGQIEPGEEPLQAALRETQEELGLGSAHIQPGPALPVLRHQAGFPLYPFLGRLTGMWQQALHPGKAEVDSLFSVPLDFFCSTAPELYRCETTTIPPEHFPLDKIGFPQGYPWRRGQVDVPLWIWQGHPIWGLTARVILSLVKQL